MAGNEALLLKIKINEKTPQLLIVIKQNLSHTILVLIFLKCMGDCICQFQTG